MAKSKSFFGLRTGSTKTLTFQVNAGKQITKDRVEIVKNPRTMSQMVQRMLMATVTAGYSWMRDICDHSFEGVSYGAKNMAEFVRLNLKAIRADYLEALAQFSYNPYRDRALYPSPFIMSKGSLQYDQSRLLVYSAGSTLLLTISTPQIDYHNQSVADLGDMLGLQLGDLVTIPFVYQDSVEQVWKFAYVRLRYVATTDAKIDSVQLSDYFSVVASEGTPTIDVSSGSFDIEVTGISYSLNQVYGTVILSRKSASGWLRSNATLQFPTTYVNTPDAATALATYPVGDDYILNGAAVGGGLPIIPQLATTPSLPVSGSTSFVVNSSVPLSLDDIKEHVSLTSAGVEHFAGLSSSGLTWQLGSGAASLNRFEGKLSSFEIVISGPPSATVEDISYVL